MVTAAVARGAGMCVGKGEPKGVSMPYRNVRHADGRAQSFA